MSYPTIFGGILQGVSLAKQQQAETGQRILQDVIQRHTMTLQDQQQQLDQQKFAADQQSQQDQATRLAQNDQFARIGDISALTRQYLSQGYSGEEIANALSPLVKQYNLPDSILDGIRQTAVSPKITQTFAEQAAKRETDLAKSDARNLVAQGRTRAEVYNRLRSGGLSEADATAESDRAFGELHGAHAAATAVPLAPDTAPPSPGLIPSVPTASGLDIPTLMGLATGNTQASPPTPLTPGSSQNPLAAGSAANPLTPDGAENPFAVPGLQEALPSVIESMRANGGGGAATNGVLPSVQSKLDSQAANRGLTQARTDRTNQQISQSDQLFPLTIKLRGAQINLTNAKLDDLQQTLPVKLAQMVAATKQTTSRTAINFIEAQTKQMQQDDLRALSGPNGGAASSRVRASALAREAVLEGKSNQIRAKKADAEKTLSLYTTTQNSPLPPAPMPNDPNYTRDLADYQRAVQGKAFAQQDLPRIRNYIAELNDGDARIRALIDQNKPYKNAGVLNQNGNTLAPITPPKPGSNQATTTTVPTRHGVYNPKTGKVDYSQMSDADIKRAMAKRLLQSIKP